MISPRPPRRARRKQARSPPRRQRRRRDATPPRRGAQRQRIARRRLQQQQQPDRRQQQSDDLLEPADRQPRQPPRTHPGRGRGRPVPGPRPLANGEPAPPRAGRRHRAAADARRVTRLTSRLSRTAAWAANRNTAISTGRRNPPSPRPIRPPSSPITAPHRAALTSPSAQAASGVAPRRAATVAGHAGGKAIARAACSGSDSARVPPSGSFTSRVTRASSPKASRSSTRACTGFSRSSAEGRSRRCSTTASGRGSSTPPSVPGAEMRGGGGLQQPPCPSSSASAAASCASTRPRNRLRRSSNRATSALAGRASRRAGVSVCNPRPRQGSTAIRSASAQCLVEIVGDKQDRNGQSPPQRGEFRLQLAACGAIDGGKRLIQQQHRRIARQRPRHCHPLLLAAGEFGGPPVFERPKDVPARNNSRTRAARRSGGRWPHQAAATFAAAVICGNRA